MAWVQRVVVAAGHCVLRVTIPRDGFASSLSEVSTSLVTPRVALTSPDEDDDPRRNAMLHSASERAKAFAVAPGGSCGGSQSPDIALLWKAILGNVSGFFPKTQWW